MLDLLKLEFYSFTAVFFWHSPMLQIVLYLLGSTSTLIYLTHWSPFENPIAFAFTFFNTLSFYI